MSEKNEKNKLIHHETVNGLLLLKWGDGLESVLEFHTLREHCPCANCAGEKEFLICASMIYAMRLHQGYLRKV